MISLLVIVFLIGRKILHYERINEQSRLGNVCILIFRIRVILVWNELNE